MRYLLDANVLIDANRLYYPLDCVPEYWAWLLHHAEHGVVKLPQEIYDEVKVGTGELAQWVRDEKSSLLLPRQVSSAQLRMVMRAYSQGRALNDDDISKIGKDPFLIAYAARDPSEFCIVTTEVSAPSKRRANRKIPDVADEFGVDTLDPFEFTRALDFRTDWSSRIGT